jgi:hypothetical protein
MIIDGMIASVSLWPWMDMDRISASAPGLRRSCGPLYRAVVASVLFGGLFSAGIWSVSAAILPPLSSASLVADKSPITLTVSRPRPGEYRLQNLLFESVSILENLDERPPSYSAAALRIAVRRYAAAEHCWEDVLLQQDVWLQMGGTKGPATFRSAVPFGQDTKQHLLADREHATEAVGDKGGAADSDREDPLSAETTPVPLPGALFLLVGGLIGLRLRRHNRIPGRPLPCDPGGAT